MKVEYFRRRPRLITLNSSPVVPRMADCTYLLHNKKTARLSAARCFPSAASAPSAFVPTLIATLLCKGASFSLYDNERNQQISRALLETLTYRDPIGSPHTLKTEPSIIRGSAKPAYEYLHYDSSTVTRLPGPNF